MCFLLPLVVDVQTQTRRFVMRTPFPFSFTVDCARARAQSARLHPLWCLKTRPPRHAALPQIRWQILSLQSVSAQLLNKSGGNKHSWITRLLSDTHKSTGAISGCAAFTGLTGSFVWVALYQCVTLFSLIQTRTSSVLRQTKHQIRSFPARCCFAVGSGRCWLVFPPLHILHAFLKAGQTGCVGKYQGHWLLPIGSLMTSTETH